MWAISGMAAVLIICSITFYIYSSSPTFTDSVNTSKLEKFLDSGQELHLSKEQTKKIIQLELDAEKHQIKGMRSLGEALKDFSVILFVFGIAQIFFCIITYMKMQKLRHNKSLQNDAKSSRV